MGAITFSIPIDLAHQLRNAGGLIDAVETGTYLGDSTLKLSELFDDVWSIEIVPEIYERAVTRTAHRDNVHLSLGYSPHVLPGVLADAAAPALFWLDGHGGTFGVPDLPDYTQCPVADEIRAIDGDASAAGACILIDDARAFFGPMPQHRPEDWPTFVEVADLLRAKVDRYVTALDDVIIAVPFELRPVVDEWWQGKLRDRNGMEFWQSECKRLRSPSPRAAAKALARSVTPQIVRSRYDRWWSSRR